MACIGSSPGWISNCTGINTRGCVYPCITYFKLKAIRILQMQMTFLIRVFLLLSFIIPNYRKLNCAIPKSLHGIQATEIIPYFQSDGKLRGYDTTVAFVYFWGTDVLFDLPYISFSAPSKQHTIRENKYMLVLKRSNAPHCIEFINRDPKNRRTITDSILMQSWIMSESISSAFNESISHLLIKQTDPKSGRITEKYLLKSKLDSSYTSIFTLTFTNRLPWLRLPNTKSLDSARNMQLIRAVTTAPSQFYKPFMKVMQGYTFTFKIVELKIDDSQTKRLLKYFDDQANN